MALKFNNINKTVVRKTDSSFRKTDQTTRASRTKLTKYNLSFLRSLKVI